MQTTNTLLKTELTTNDALSINDIYELCKIIQAHSDVKDKTVTYDENGLNNSELSFNRYGINTLGLAAVLRLADELDVASDRLGNELLAQRLSSKNFEQQFSAKRWQDLHFCSNVCIQPDDIQERLALVKQEMSEIKVEQQHFEQYTEETNNKLTQYKIREKLKSKQLMHLWQECQYISDNDSSFSLYFKIKNTVVCEIPDVTFIVTGMQVEDETAESGMQSQLISDYITLSESDTDTSTAYAATEILVHNGIQYETAVNFGSTETTVDDALQTIDETVVSYDGYAALSAAIGKFTSPGYTRNNKKAIVVFTYGGNEYASDDWIDAAVEHDITVCIVALSDRCSSSLKELAEKSGGIFVNATDKDTMDQIYNRLTVDLSDSDKDGLPDIFEIRGMFVGTQDLIYTIPYKRDTDDDGLLDGEEVTYTINNGYVKFKLVSDPYEEDSDGDGLDDIWDPRPQSVYNNGEHIDLTHDELGVLQICLVELGYTNFVFAIKHIKTIA